MNSPLPDVNIEALRVLLIATIQLWENCIEKFWKITFLCCHGKWVSHHLTKLHHLQTSVTLNYPFCLTMCETSGPFPPSLAAVALSVAFGHTWLNSQGFGEHLLGSQSLQPVDLSSGAQVGSLPNVLLKLSTSPRGKVRSWWRSQLTFLALGR